MLSDKNRFKVLIALVAVSGFSQGMLLPLLAVILERSGIPSSVNGLHATGLYIGVLAASPFMEKPMQKYGYKPVILTGGALVFISLALFPAWQALWFWFILRITVGIGDHMLHFGTQTWITTTSSPERRGRNIAYYGLFFSLGFTFGPLMTRLLEVNEYLPFLFSSILCFLVWTSLFLIRNAFPVSDDGVHTSNRSSSFSRFIQSGRLAWVALLPPFGYGFLEAVINGIFPIYGLRIGYDVSTISYIIPFFAACSLITQIPLGVMSDKYGRKKILVAVLFLGSTAFVFAGLVEHSPPLLMAAFAFSGMMVGSIYSLGISYMTDLLPETLLPAGNIMCGIAFSIGSITGPYLGGVFLDLFTDISFFYLIALVIFLITVAVASKKSQVVSR